MLLTGFTVKQLQIIGDLIRAFRDGGWLKWIDEDGKDRGGFIMGLTNATGRAIPFDSPVPAAKCKLRVDDRRYSLTNVLTAVERGEAVITPH